MIAVTAHTTTQEPVLLKQVYIDIYGSYFEVWFENFSSSMKYMLSIQGSFLVLRRRNRYWFR